MSLLFISSCFGKQHFKIKIVNDMDQNNQQEQLPPLVVRADCPSYSDEVADSLISVVNALLDQLQELEWIDDCLAEVIITDDIKRTVSAIAAEWGIGDVHITREKESAGVAKTLYRNGRESECCLVIDGRALMAMPMAASTVMGMVIMITCYERMPDDIRNAPGYVSNTPLADILKLCLKEWVPRSVAYKVLGQLKLLQPSDNSVELFLNEFRRKIKAVHYTYQADRDEHQLRIAAISAVSHLVTRGIESYHSEDKFKDNGNLGKALNALVEKTLAVTKNVEEGHKYDLEPVVSGFQQLLELCYMNLDPLQDGKRCAGLFITEVPKLLFRGELVDTEQRFVAFLDVLGFAAMIEEYDSNPQSNVLKLLKNALETAIAQATARADYSESLVQSWGVKEFYEHFNDLIDYRMFSDCFCVSLPYFDSQTDFTVQAASIITTIRIFILCLLSDERQLTLIRGGLATGSYYSDQHTIFSGGLVDAYKIEKDIAKYPRVVVASSIVDRLKNNSPMLKQMLGLTKSLVLDTDDGCVFINPFGLNDKIAIPLKDVVEGLELLHQQIGRKVDTPEELWGGIHAVVNGVPELGAGMFEVAPPPEVMDKVPDIDVNVLVTKVQVLIKDCQIKIEAGDNTVNGVLKKYEWFLEFILWWSGHEDHGRFEYVLVS